MQKCDFNKVTLPWILLNAIKLNGFCFWFHQWFHLCAENYD